LFVTLPVVLRILLENVARTQTGADREASIAAIHAWLETGTSEAEIPVQPCRVLMHDTTATPALVDVAALRDAVAEEGGDPASLSPRLPVDISVDHSLAVEVHARSDAVAVNQAHEMRRNAERYRFMRWAAAALPNVRIHPPGTGIMHTINVEQLATIVREGAYPELMIGTDSHTPMVNGLGVLAWGVGGLEAEAVMFGMPIVMRVPDVIGVRLTGRLGSGALSTDLALVVTHRLREIGISGEFVEFFGPGVSTLSAADRCVVANMAPEYGATTGYFPVDGKTLEYLRQTGRAEALIAQIEEYFRGHGLWFDPAAEPRYTRAIEIDLGSVGMHVAGPRRPQDLRPFWETVAALEGFAPSPAPFPIAIAAITSCTNTTDPRLLVAAGLVARKARVAGLRVDPRIKTSLSPGSPAAARYLARAGLTDDLAALGFDIVGYGCATCIGNSGPLPPDDANGKRVAVLSGNRNFPGRIHPDLDLAFIMSPPLVVAFAIAGDARSDFRRDGFIASDGRRVSLDEIWPGDEEIDAVLKAALDPDDFPMAFRAASAAPVWQELEHAAGARFPWSPKSTILRRPPFASRDAGSLLGNYAAHPLLVLGDDITTDHISPASAIPDQSLVADYLVEHGEDRADLNVFASRRGNWEVMMRAAFHNRTLVNHYAPGVPVAHTIHAPSGDVLPLWIAAERYEHAGDSVVLVAGHRFGTGSSRDWAAKGQRLLGIRAVIASSFERIHRSNLISMGILPVKLPADVGSRELALRPGDRIEVDATSVQPRSPIAVTVIRRNGERQQLACTTAVETTFEADLLRAGGILPYILKST
jgi:aconitate hydratase